MALRGARSWLGPLLASALVACGGGGGGGGAGGSSTTFEVRNSALSLLAIQAIRLEYEFPYPDVTVYRASYPVRLDPGEGYRIAPPPGSIGHVVEVDWSDGSTWPNVYFHAILTGDPLYTSPDGAQVVELRNPRPK